MARLTGAGTLHGPMASTERADLPQLATRQNAVVTSVEWLVEPCWKGDRLLARFADGRVELMNENGTPVGAWFAEAARELAAAIDAQEALIDGIWTAIPFFDQGSLARSGARGSGSGLPEITPPPEAEASEPRGTFVAWDLVELDGQTLHDIPLLERRRLLASVLVEGPRVRISPSVRLPGVGWSGAWRAHGFTHYVAKHMNSRYLPGTTTAEWLQIPIEPDNQPSFITMILGRRPRRVPHIRD